MREEEMKVIHRVQSKLNEYIRGGYIPKPFDTIPKIVLILDMAICRLCYGININDYFAYRFYMLNHRGRKSFLTSNRDYFKLWKLNDMKFFERFENKAEFTNYYGQYMGRDQFVIDKDTDQNVFNTWLDNQINKGVKKFIIKKVDGARGADIFTLESEAIELRNINILQIGEVVIEPVIRNHPELEKLHPASLNTIRIPIILSEGEPIVMGAYLRIGNNNEVVDNFSHGGILVEVDVKTGVTFTRGVDKKGNEYLYHPVTGELLVGIKIPMWERSIELVKQVAVITPEVVYSSWDVAITSDGPVIIEGNFSGDVDLQQIPQHYGKRWLYEKVVHGAS